MRVRSNRQSETRRRSGSARRGSVLRREQAAPGVDEPEPAAASEDDLFDEHRLRASGGPDDRAQYTCGCGYVWKADVSASVACPNCGASQAW
jgi:rubrerythrin